MTNARLSKALLTAAVCATAASAQADEMWVQVAKGALRNQPQMFAPSVAPLAYGDKLTQLAPPSEGWVKVSTAAGKTGFVHESALSAKQIVLSGRLAADTKAESSNVVLASKGFSKEIEAQYKTRDPGARYDLVDQVERIEVSPKDLGSFVKSGQLKG